ncbi:MAG: glycosyltransferase family 4 protein [Nostocaceae cyanobacterium]|nr:glycosyltransferase family 4 protein [Nostocaceae cyanobacterium]
MKKLKIIMIGCSLELHGGIATLQKLIIKYVPPDIEIQHITSHDDGTIAYKLMIFALSWIKFVWRLLHAETDIVHIHVSDGPSIFRKAILSLTAFAFRKPVLMHTNGPEFHLTYEKLPQWTQQALNKVFRKCSGFIVLTNVWRNYYVPTLGLNEKQVFVLLNPAELPEQVPNRINSSKVKLVFCGRIGRRKGAFDLINAFAQLPDELRKHAELILAGDGEVEQAIQLVESLNITDQVTFLGWIDAQQRDALLEKADVFILPSYNEGLPLALIEAMAWGLPAIATPVSGIPEIVTSGVNGLLVNPGDIQQLAEAMQSLIEDENLRQNLGKVARQTVIPLDIRPFSDRLNNIYHSILYSPENIAISANKYL